MPNFTLLAQNLHFDYNDKTKVFENHSLKLEVPETQPNKLYGIIGPSGSGKTTLLSILGGQLKPTNGQILINQTDIYGVSDVSRRKLIALQMQTATSLRSKLRYNLLFGLPSGEVDILVFKEFENEKLASLKNSKTIPNQYLQKNTPSKTSFLPPLKRGIRISDTNSKNFEQIYPDKFLIEILTKVGLWKLFEPKDGLETLIGEGGLNLSGGQRQRLNFAGLYLRIQYFEPRLVLIDEPTSSLDEISEQEITKMMQQIAQKSVTLVIAHRLKTLENSVAILDCSDLENKKMQFLEKPQLLQNSFYYQELLPSYY